MPSCSEKLDGLVTPGPGVVETMFKHVIKYFTAPLLPPCFHPYFQV